MEQEALPVGGDRFGSDVVCIEPDRVVIFASQPMDDWSVREFCRVPIFVNGRKYYLRSKEEASPPFEMRYELCPWPKELHEESRQKIYYTKGYVADRDKAYARERRGETANILLMPFYPLLGLFWSGFKRRVLIKAGFEPSSVTKASIVLIFNLWIVEGIFVGWLQGGLLMLIFSSIALEWADWFVLVILGLDAVMRFSGVLREGAIYHHGFCEWLWPWKSRW